MFSRCDSYTVSAFAASFAMLLVAGCQPDIPKQNAPVGHPRVAVTNFPLQYFAQRIGGDLLGVEFLVPADEDPAYWNPTPEDILQIQTADLILLNGADYEKWLATTTLPQAKTVDTSRAFADALIPLKDVVTHSHGPTGLHSHGGLAKTTWLDFQQARAQARAIAEAFMQKWPEHRGTFEANAKTLDDDLTQLDQSMAAVAAKIGQTPLVVSHPEYDYWSRRYQLNIASVHWEAGEDPSEEAMSELQRVLASHPAKFMIWEDEPDETAVAKLEVLGIQSVVFAPRGNATGENDWLTLMRENIANLDRAISETQLPAAVDK